MQNKNIEVITTNIEEACHYSKRACMKVSEYGLWAMTSWLYYEKKKQGEATPLMKVLKEICALGVICGCLSDVIYGVRKLLMLKKQTKK